MTQGPDVAERAELEQEEEGAVPTPGDPARAGRAGRARGRRTAGRRRRRWLVAVGALALVVGWYVGWGSPATLVEHVVVDAPRGISAESIRMASGISAEDHVPAVDAEEVRMAIMTAIPAVADVALTRSLPSTIRLKVTARTPFAALESGSGFYVMDAEGVIYDRVKSAKRLPVIEASTDVGRQTARTVLLDLPEDLRRRVTTLKANTRDDVTLTLRGGATVRWGSAESSELKARVLAGLATVKADRYDVSAPLLPTTSAPVEGSAG
jgi:cell division protein FtsQ